MDASTDGASQPFDVLSPPPDSTSDADADAGADTDADTAADADTETDAPRGCAVDSDCRGNFSEGCSIPSCGADHLCTTRAKPEDAGCLVTTSVGIEVGYCAGGECIWRPSCSESDCGDTDDNPCNGKWTCAPLSVGRSACVGWKVPPPGYVCNTSPRHVCNTDGECVASLCGNGAVDDTLGEECEPPSSETCDQNCRTIDGGADAQGP